MSITNERLRELATKPHDGVTAEERQSMAAELLAARERIDFLDSLKMNCETLHARAEKAEAERDSMYSADIYHQAVDSLRVVVGERDALWSSHAKVLDDLCDAASKAERLTAERDAARAEVERLRAELDSEIIRADELRGRVDALTIYRDRTEAALVQLCAMQSFGLVCVTTGDLAKLGLARDAKGE